MTARTTTTHESDAYRESARLEDLNAIDAIDDVIDLRRYVLILLRWWREILLITVGVGLLASATVYLYFYARTPSYAASADIAIARLASNIELDDRVSTTSGAVQSDPNGWRTSLLQLSQSSVVANAVFDELKNELPAAVKSPEMLAAMIDARVPLSPDDRYSSNLIRISATTGDPKLSAQIANAWARHLVDYINGLYGEVPETTIESVSAERDRSFADYQAAEKAYEEFVANSQIDTLTRQIQQKTTLRNEIMANYTRMLTTVVSSEYESRLEHYSALVTAPTKQALALIDAQSQGTANALASLYGQRISALAQLNQARAMEASLAAGGEAAAKSNGAALQLLKLSVFAAEFGTGRLPLMTPPTGAGQAVDMGLDEQLTDVRVLITVLEARVAQVDDDITQLAQTGMIGADPELVGGLQPVAEGATASVSDVDQVPAAESLTGVYADLLSPDGFLHQAPVDIDSAIKDAHEEVLSTLESEIRALQAAITAENARERELAHRRDVAWTTYDTVGNKLEELNLLRSSANTEVRVGNPAMVPFEPVPALNPLVPVVGLTLLALAFAVAVALLADSLGIGPFLARRPV